MTGWVKLVWLFQKISKTFSHNNLESVLLFCTFEPKKCKCAFRVAVSACTLKILCCGYNMATIKKDKKIKDYDTRSCSGMVIFPSLRFVQANRSLSYNNLGIFSLSFYFFLDPLFDPLFTPKMQIKRWEYVFRVNIFVLTKWHSRIEGARVTSYFLIINR